MKLNIAASEVELSNVGPTGEFKIRNSAKAFKILSDGLYSNKIKAIIRELSCNALDSHVAAGNTGTKFDVHLPSSFEPWFAVRDYGTGLDAHQVTSIYTTYFESTKTDSNDFIGALGLGSKSPFSYTDNFTVTAIKDGVQLIFSAYINEAGVPSIVEMGKDATTEPNGVEVKFSVTNTSDFSAFATEAKSVFMWFKQQPNVTPSGKFSVTQPKYHEKDIMPGVHLHDTYSSYNNSTASIAVMGNIAYPLNDIPNVEKELGEHASLLNCGLVIEFEIGELDFAASREHLSYIPLTIRSIREKLVALTSQLSVRIVALLADCKNEWDKASMLRNKYQHTLYRAAILKYVVDNKFPLVDINNPMSTKSLILTIDDLTACGLSITAFSSTRGSTTTINPSYSWGTGNNNKLGHYVAVQPSTVIILNDLSTGCVTRARAHFNSTAIGLTKYVFCVSHSDPDVAVRTKAYDKLLADLHHPPIVIKASDLEKIVRAPKPDNQGIMELVIKQDYQYNRNSNYNYTWAPCSPDTDITKGDYNYVYLSNTSAISKADAPVAIHEIKSLMVASGITSVSDIKIFGVQKSARDKIKNLPNWVWFEEKLKTEIAAITDEHIMSLVATDELDSHHKKVYTNTHVASCAGKESPYAKFVRKSESIERIDGSATSLVALCSRYGKVMAIDKVRAQMSKTKMEVINRYPMLSHLKADPDQTTVADYIMLVDRHNK